VTVRTRDLEGAGWIQAYTTQGKWEVIFFSPSGSFTFQERLPFHAWHCDPPNGTDGCVALLQAGDNKGYLNVAGRTNGKFAVCTGDYHQKIGRKHCGERAFVEVDAASPVTIPLSRNQTSGPTSTDFPLDAGIYYEWKGDPWSRLVTASHVTHPDADNYNPPEDDGQITSHWYERAYTPGGYNTVSPLSAANFSVDLGACSIFFPWEWQDRLQDDLWTQAIGVKTGNRGFAEIMLDGIIENAKPNEGVLRDVLLFFDAVGSIVPRTDVSPEFHLSFGGASNATVPAHNEVYICLKTYFTASNVLDESVDDWYRWDQGLLGGLVELFNIGECHERPASAFYCGSIGIGTDQNGYFRIDPDVVVNMQDYGVFKPLCNNQFIPRFKGYIKDGIRTVGRQNLSDGVNDFVQAMNQNLGIKIRALWPTATGIYIVTAHSLEDPQYGVGNCLSDIEKKAATMPKIQPSVGKTFGTRGIRRF
jgi:hypothetical protein